MPLHPKDDLIVARATAPGAAAVAIVRADGRGAADLLRSLFRPRGKTHPAAAPRRAIFGSFIDPSSPASAPIDEGLAIFFAAPRSFTGNDLAELQCHGGGAVVRRIIAAAVALGARPAEPGEFTRRAFLNGRIDLAQAEAIADLIRAETGAAARAAESQLAGGLSRAVGGARSLVIDAAAEIEARIDFPEEGIEPADAARIAAMMDDAAASLRALLASRGRGRLLREGARVALVGPPNVGKSSLLNALARSDRAIVTPHPGTTRDTVECVIDLAGVAVTLVDTAGLREAAEPIEQIGIERARRAALEADLIAEVRDASGAVAPLPAASLARAPDLVILNKIDLAPAASAAASNGAGLRVSAVTGAGVADLERAILEKLGGEGGALAENSGGEFAVAERHASLLERALASLAEARAAWIQNRGGEFAAIDLKEALAALDEILGIGPNEAVLDRVFERFCLGK